MPTAARVSSSDIPPAGIRNKTRYAEPIDGYTARDPQLGDARENHAPQISRNVPSTIPQPRRRSQVTQKRQQPRERQGLEVLPALMDEEIPPQELLMMLAMLLG